MSRRSRLTLGLTGTTRPVNPDSSSRSSSWPPKVSRLRLAPMTAIVAGLSSLRRLWASARCSRLISTARERSVGSMSKPTSTTPSSTRRATS